ncbi:LAQU0S01e00562g1_1 [Lachancea quebecensis]|uniref:Phosphotransferase n=1 Tax=Lachancea quebecensis TaxID=1654605 RepID=A0A0P1KLI9_9SACH|nr:LAQU0S01e00562g1_1 [Lachancea quebecensis]
MAIDNGFIQTLRHNILPGAPLEDIINECVTEIEERLRESDVSMLPSGVIGQNRPVSAPPGEKHLAIDFGGSSIKLGFVCASNLNISWIRTLAVTEREVDLQFFDAIVGWICDQVREYIEANRIEPDALFIIGTTFSFPLNERGEVMTMGKGYILTEEVTDVSVTTILEHSFRRVLEKRTLQFRVQLRGVINDSAAVFLANRARDGASDVSLILGTGINACFSLANARLPESKQGTGVAGDTRVMINSEIGFLGARYVKMTQFDPADEGPIMPLEYVSSGKWLPLTLEKVLRHFEILPDSLEGLEFDGKLVCAILCGATENIFGAERQKQAEEVCKVLVERAAIYTSCALLAVLQFSGHDRKATGSRAEVGFAGSFLQNCAAYRARIEELSGGVVRLRYLENSNLLGAFLHSCEGACAS